MRCYVYGLVIDLISQFSVSLIRQSIFKSINQSINQSIFSKLPKKDIILLQNRRTKINKINRIHRNVQPLVKIRGRIHWTINRKTFGHKTLAKEDQWRTSYDQYTLTIAAASETEFNVKYFEDVVCRNANSETNVTKPTSHPAFSDIFLGVLLCWYLWVFFGGFFRVFLQISGAVEIRVSRECFFTSQGFRIRLAFSFGVLNQTEGQDQHNDLVQAHLWLSNKRICKRLKSL